MNGYWDIFADVIRILTFQNANGRPFGQSRRPGAETPERVTYTSPVFRKTGC